MQSAFLHNLNILPYWYIENQNISATTYLTKIHKWLEIIYNFPGNLISVNADEDGDSNNETLTIVILTLQNWRVDNGCLLGVR